MTITSYEIIDYLGIFDTFMAGCIHQPEPNPAQYVQYYINIDRVDLTPLSSTYNLCPANPLAPIVSLSSGIFTEVEETTMLGVYIISDGFDYGSSNHAFKQYQGNVETRVSTDTNPYSAQQFRNEFPPITTNPAPNCYGLYSFVVFSRYVSKYRYYRRRVELLPIPVKPTYIDLLRGYYLDTRSIPNYPEIIPTQTKTVTIQYYRENDLEPIPGLRSIDWLTYKCTLTKDIPVKLPIERCVLGTLYCDDLVVLSQILGLPNVSGLYDWHDLLPQSLPSLFSHWIGLYSTASIPPLIPAGAFNIEAQTETGRILRTIGANNNHWNNQLNPVSDLNPDPNHPMFLVDNSRAYEWHIEPQGIDYTTGLDKGNGRYSKGAFFSSLISEQSIKEVIAGLGLRTVDKYLEFKVAGKMVKLYYKGISASQSVRRKLSAIATNVGITIGNII